MNGQWILLAGFHWDFCFLRSFWCDPFLIRSDRILTISFIYIYIFFIDYAITVVPFPPLHSTPSFTPIPSHIPPYSSCPWVIHISSLASTFPILFLPSPYFLPTIYATYSLYLSLLSPSYFPVDNPPCDLHFCGSVPVLVVCLVCFCFCFRCGC